MKKVKFQLDKKAANEALLKSEKVNQIMDDVAGSILANVEAQFFQQFGVVGKFEMKTFASDRSNVKIAAADKATAAVLKRHPLWLNQFIDNVNI